MKCPYCGYEHGYSMDSFETVKGKEGDFYTISNSIHMERTQAYNSWEVEKSSVYACPSCKKLFID